MAQNEKIITIAGSKTWRFLALCREHLLRNPNEEHEGAVTLSQKDQAVTKQIPSVSIFQFGYLGQFSSQVVESPDFPARNLQSYDCLYHSTKMAGKVRVTVVFLWIWQVPRKRRILSNLKTFVPGKRLPEIFQILSPNNLLPLVCILNSPSKSSSSL